MKSTGIVRRIDELGRIVLPKELRKTLDLPEGTPMEVYVEGNRVVLHKYQPEAWSTDELKDALVAAAKDAGRDPVDYLTKLGRRRKADGNTRNHQSA